MAETLTLVIGGAVSGKSVFAEDLVKNAAGHRTYLATAQAFDDEMRAKIDRHIARRGSGWTTVEAPLEAADVLSRLSPEDTCLLDCATLWISNQLLADHDLAAEEARLIAAIRTCPARLVIVSNEVGHGVVPDNALARRFRDAQGRLNILLAQEAQTVIQVTVGLPLVLKGGLT